MIDLFQARRESHEARELGHEFKIQEGGVSLEVPRVEGQAFYPSGDAPRMARDGTPMENIKEGLADLPKAVGSAGAGLAAGAAGLPGDLVSLIGGLGSALFPGDQSRLEAFTTTMTDISKTIGSERFLGLYRDIVNNSDFSLEDKQMMLDTAEGASFLSIPGAATVAKGSSDAIRSGVVKAGEAAQARLDEAAGSTTLASGVDVGKGIDQAIAAAGRQFADAQVRYFETGKFEPPTAENPVSVVKPTETEPGIIAFHGSGADFDEFRLEMIGTGEGAQAYGYGLYFTDSEDIAKFYRDTISTGTAKIPYDSAEDAAQAVPDNVPFLDVDGYRSYLMGDAEEVLDSVLAKQYAGDNPGQGIIDFNLEILKKAGVLNVKMPDGTTASLLMNQAGDQFTLTPVKERTGKMYKVGLSPKPDELLDYDGPIGPDFAKKVLQSMGELRPKEVAPGRFTIVQESTTGDGPVAMVDDAGQMLPRLVKSFTAGDGSGVITAPSIEEAEKAVFASVGKMTGKDALRMVAVRLGGDRQGAEALAAAGIPGLKYRAAGSRSSGVTDEAAERNYVIFDDKAVKILEKYGIAGPVAITAAAAGQSNDNEDGGI